MDNGVDQSPRNMDVLRPIMSETTLRQVQEPGAPYYTFVTRPQALTCGFLIRTWCVSTYWPDLGPPRLVGRAGYGHSIVPALVNAYLCDAVVCVNRDYRHVNDYELLLILRGRPVWIPASGGDVPPYALPVGLTSEGETEYAVRALAGRHWIFGRLQPNRDLCEVVEASGNLKYHREYEVLAVMN